MSNAFILTWNPKVWDWPADDYLAEVAETEAGRSVRGQWSVGNRRQGIGPGDLAFLVRQNSDRGIVAVGEFVSEIFEEAHFMDSGRTAAYATVEWSRIVLPADRLPIEVLLGEVPEVPWNNLMSSGIQVPSGARERILELWNDRVEAIYFRAPDEVIEAVEFIEGAVSVVTAGSVATGGSVLTVLGWRVRASVATIACVRCRRCVACVGCVGCIDCIGCLGCVGCVGLRGAVGVRGVAA